jgi:hypothetical protein
MDKYLKAIKENVCAICVDSSEKGKCTLHKDETCAVEFYFPQIMEIIKDNYNSDKKIMLDKLRAKICVDCRAQNEEEFCYLREDANCSLDRYFNVIVDVVYKVDKGKL